jgi:hypothetical protein
LKKGDKVRVNLFSDRVYVSKVRRVVENVNGTVTVVGGLEGFEFGYMVVCTTDGRTLGDVVIPELGERYLILPGDGGEVHSVLGFAEGDLEVFVDGPALRTPDVEVRGEFGDDYSGAVYGGSVGGEGGVLSGGFLDIIDVMILYTPAAELWASSNGGIDNVVAQAMAKAQLALDNSGTDLVMELVYSGEVSYVESGSISDDLVNLRVDGDGVIDEIHGWRDDYGADLVSLFEDLSGVGGIGYVLSWEGGSPNYGFSVCRVQQVGWTYTLIHELGHNMGCGHHKEQNQQPGPGLYDYSAGWRWQGTDDGYYCSVMAYAGGEYYDDGQDHTRVGHFSNPDIDYAGVATGEAVDGDNARTIWEVKGVVGDYRSRPLISGGDGLAGFAKMAASWQISEGEAGYDESCDLYEDGVIDAFDLQIFAGGWLN